MSLTAAGSGSPSTLVKVLAFLPPTAPFAMPALVGLGTATWWEFTASAAISVLCTIAVARLAITIYRRAVLRTGRRVHLPRALFCDEVGPRRSHWPSKLAVTLRLPQLRTGTSGILCLDALAVATNRRTWRSWPCKGGGLDNS